MTPTLNATAIFLQQIERHYDTDGDLSKVVAYLLEHEESVDPDDLHATAMERLRTEAANNGGRLGSDERSELLDEIYSETFENYGFEEGRWGSPHEFNGTRYVATESVAAEIAESRCRDDIGNNMEETWFLREVVSTCWKNGTSYEDYVDSQVSEAIENYLGGDVDTFDVARTTYYVWDM